MVDSHVMPDGTSPNNTVSESVRITAGNRFTVAASTNITALRWYRYDTGTVKPNSLLFWSTQTGQIIVQMTPNDNGAVGWQQAALPTPIQLFVGVTYCVGGDEPVGFHRAQWTPHTAPDSGVTWQGSFWTNNTGGSNGQPVNSNGDNEYGFDAVMSPPATPPTGLTTADLDNHDAAWFDSGGDNTHHDALPWATKAELDTVAAEVADIQSKVTDTQGKANGATGFDAIKAVADAIASAVGGLPGTIASAITTITGQAATNLARIVGDGDATITSISHDVANVENHLLDVAFGHAGFPSGTPNTTWSMAAETDFDTTLSWAQPADLYVVHISAVRPGLGADSFAGLTWYHRLGSWCVLNGSLGSTRRFLEFADQALEDNGRRMAGLAIRCQPGTIGTVQAWTLG